jgi:hypothetical protein
MPRGIFSVQANVGDVSVPVRPFVFPNFLAVDQHGRDVGRWMIPVSDMSDEQASALWDAMKDNWLSHVRVRRASRGGSNG